MRISDWGSDVCSSDLVLAAAGAACDQHVERIADTQQPVQLGENFLALLDRASAHVSAVGVRIGPQRQQLGDLAQREADVLRLTNETDTVNRVDRKSTRLNSSH